MHLMWPASYQATCDVAYIPKMPSPDATFLYSNSPSPVYPHPKNPALRALILRRLALRHTGALKCEPGISGTAWCAIHIGVNTAGAGDTGDMSPAKFGLPGIQYFGPRKIISIQNIKLRQCSECVQLPWQHDVTNPPGPVPASSLCQATGISFQAA